MNCFQASIPILKALCDETRLQILSMLSEREMNGCEIHRAFDCTQPTISYHMKALVDVGLVHARPGGLRHDLYHQSGNLARGRGAAARHLPGREGRVCPWVRGSRCFGWKTCARITDRG